MIIGYQFSFETLIVALNEEVRLDGKSFEM